MRLALTFPSPWRLQHAPDGRTAAVLPGPDADGPPALVAAYGPLIIAPDEPRRWVDQVAGGELPRGARVAVGAITELTTSDGWPLRLVEAELTADDGSGVVEVRLCALYTFLEHAGAVVVRAGSRAALATHADAVRAILVAGRPDWRAQPLCIAHAWDLERPRALERMVDPPRPAAAAYFAGEIERLAALPAPTATDHVQRGLALLASDRAEDALAAAHAALALDDASETAHALAGVALGTLGRPDDAIAAWTRAAAIAPRVDTHYNLGQAHYARGDFAAALAAFEAARAIDRDDLLIARKEVQCLYALARYADGADARRALVQQWATSSDPRARMTGELVFDQHDAPGFRVHAVDTLRQRDPGVRTLMTFRAVDRSDHPLGAAVLVETSEVAQRAGTPFVIGVATRGGFQVLASLATMPAYPALREQAVGWLTRALQ